MNKTLILSDVQIAHKIRRMAWQLVETNFRENELVVAGIRGRGFHLACMLANELKKIEACPPIELFELHINKENPLDADQNSWPEADLFSNKVIVVVDDVLDSGRTLLYGVKQFLHIPVKKIVTLVLVDRNHRSFPVNADFVGLSLATTLQEHVSVVLNEQDCAVFLQDSK